MSYSSLLLVVLAAMAHATWNLLAKRAAMVGAPFVFAYGLCASVLYAPWVVWVMPSCSSAHVRLGAVRAMGRVGAAA